MKLLSISVLQGIRGKTSNLYCTFTNIADLYNTCSNSIQRQNVLENTEKKLRNKISCDTTSHVKTHNTRDFYFVDLLSYAHTANEDNIELLITDNPTKQSAINIS